MRMNSRVTLTAVALVAALGIAQCGRSAESQDLDRTGSTSAVVAGTQGVAARAPGSPTGLTSDERALIGLFDQTAPSVVQVVVLARTRSVGSVDVREVGGGSGFVWDNAGHIITNNHVVEGAPALMVRLADGRSLPAQIVGRAPNHDLAVLRVSDPRALPPPIAIGRSETLRVGQSAFAIGYPFALDQTLTQGIISALNRRLPTQTGREINGLIQTDASINPGNSGGPLLDSSGRLIGVNTAILSPSGANAGIGFAIPADTVARIAPQLIETGRAPTAGIGISVLDEFRTARLGVDGVIVMTVAPGGPAERAGLRPARRTIEDVIVAANGRPVRRLIELIRVVDEAGIGATVTLEVVNNGQTRTVRVPVADIGD